jgi:[ribosomal protein S5]-alanine N-acetyltransferase
LIFTTPHLILREIEERDLDALLNLYNDSQARRYEQPLDKVYVVEDVRDRIAWAIADQQADPRTRFRLAITVPPDGLLCGWVTLQSQNSDIREWELGWSLRRDLWGQGYATEAASAMMRFAFEQLGAHRLVAFCHSENAASVRVMQKLGMQYEGRIRGTRWLNECWCDELVYAILEQDYRSGYTAV